ncbi:uncharacterized protein (DUF3820 family) [Massilia umbonata]|uniref:Uncharacterized protein (DUF3820 family) n=2 Tax=Pseudoduganella umbonata TaxID=864828 RepID=A0A7W5EG88_9BURK|nr:uncharacterized protein (DUF3820 family) [Pseudoduganella umbonata]
MDDSCKVADAVQYHGSHSFEKDAPTQKFFDLGATIHVSTMNSEALSLLLVREMPYGKYQGRKLADLPGHYLGWMARAGFPKGELGALLALMYELDHNNLRGLLDPLPRS